MEEYRYPKSGYTLLAVKLIYGERSPHVEQFSVFGLPPHNDTRLEYTEVENARDGSMGPGINACQRTVHFGDGCELSSTVTQGTGINTLLMYKYLTQKQSVILSPWERVVALAGGMPYEHHTLGDVMFSTDEYEYFNFHWDEQVQYKVDALSRLIRTLDTGDIGQRPTFLGDFPEIAKYLIANPTAIQKREPLWP